MTNETVGDDERTSNADSDSQGGDQQVIWDDPSVPVGDAPPLSTGPMVALGLAWLALTVFLVVMAISRMHAPVL